jgi:hypothetical protein
MTRTLPAFAAASIVALGASLLSQAPAAPAINFESVADILRTPPDIHVGEVAGVGRNSRGHIFVYTRTGHPYATLADNRTFYRGGSRLFQFDSNGIFVRELGQDVYGFNAAIGLRIDPQDNIWTIDEGANQVVKFDSDGRIQLVLGRKPETMSVRPRGGGPEAGGPAAAGRGGPPVGGRGEPPAGRGVAPSGARGAAPVGGAASAEPGRGGAGAPGGRGGSPGSGTPGSSFSRPTDVAWDAAGNIYIADGIGTNNRIAKFDKDGRFIAHWGSTGTANGQFQGVKGIAIDRQGNVYVADRGNKRIQVFEGNGMFRSAFGNVGTPTALCMTTGSTQYLYVSHVGDPDGMEDAAIYKVQLDGRVVGRFGSAGKLPKEFGTANSIDCRNENELLVGEMTNWRVQKIALR